MSYGLLKALHVIFMVAWFAGLFYIFRLFVYHVENWEHKNVRDLFLVMERKLLNYIMAPAFVLTAFWGLSLLGANPGLMKMPWFHIKLTFVLLLLGYHGYAYYVFTQFRQERKILSSRACRLINEVPTLILIAVCLLVFLKPVL